METITGSNGGDLLNDTQAVQTIFGLDGDDIINSTLGTQWISFPQFVSKELYGGNGKDILNGSAQSDYLYGGNGRDDLFGGAGGDRIFVDAGEDTIRGGLGIDSLNFSQSMGTQTVQLDLLAEQMTNDGYGNTETVKGIEMVIGAATEKNKIFGDGNNNYFQGGNKADTLNGRGGDDIFQGTAGGDTIIGGAGSDWITFEGFVLDEASYNFIFETNSVAPEGVKVNLNTQVVANDGYGESGVIIGVENISGTQFKDKLTGDSGDNIFHAGAGGDSINGKGGTDTLILSGIGIEVDLAQQTITDTESGQTGVVRNVENIVGTGGADLLRGDNGDNVIYGELANYEGLTDFVFAFLGPMDTIYGGGGDDILHAGDTVTSPGNLGADEIYGGTGKDFLRGYDGDDLLKGGNGNDTIIGNSGADRIIGGAGNDKLYGGVDADVFVFGAWDTDRIYGFEDNVDTVALKRAELGIAQGASGQDIVNTFGTTTNGNVTLDFGNGDRLIFNGVTNANSIADDLTLI